MGGGGGGGGGGGDDVVTADDATALDFAFFFEKMDFVVGGSTLLGDICLEADVGGCGSLAEETAVFREEGGEAAAFFLRRKEDRAVAVLEVEGAAVFLGEGEGGEAAVFFLDRGEGGVFLAAAAEMGGG